MNPAIHLSVLTFLISTLSLTVVPATNAEVEGSPEILGILEMEEASTLRYIHSSFSNYHQIGDRIDFNGYIMQVGDWYKPLDATAKVKVQGPDDSIVFEQSDIDTDDNNSFEISLEITPDYKVGKYLAFVEPVKEGYKTVDNQYLTPFYVFRNNTNTVQGPDSQSYWVHIGSVEFESSNVNYDASTKKLSFDVTRIGGSYAPDGDLGYPGHFLFVLIEKPLLEGPLQYQYYDQHVDWPSWQANDEFHILQIGVDEIQDHATITVWSKS